MANKEDVKYLLSMKSKNDESYMFHVPNIHITDLLSQALDIPIISAETDGRITVTMYPDGSQLVVTPDGIQTVIAVDGTQTVLPDLYVFPDPADTTVSPD